MARKKLGLMDIPNFPSFNDDDDDSEPDESALESELEAILSGKTSRKPKKRQAKVNQALDLEAQIAKCLKDDIDDDDDEDDDCSDDEDLLAELKKLTIGSKEVHESLDDFSSNSNVEEQKDMCAPPEITRPDNTPVLQPTIKQDPPSAPKPKPSVVNNEAKQETAAECSKSTVDMLSQRRNQYKTVALQAKRDGDKASAINYLKTVKAFDAILEAINNNEPVDLTNIPPPPPGLQDGPKSSLRRPAPSVPAAPKEQESYQTSGLEEAAMAAANASEESNLFSAPDPPATILEALEQRLEKYTKTKEAAEAENNSGKVRRLQRIIKQYQGAIKDHKAGKKVEFEELPCPPGFPPIPVTPASQTAAPPPSTKPAPSQPTVAPVKPQPKPNPTSAPEPKPTAKPKVQRANTTSISDKQLEFLLERQKLFRQAALTAKQNGDIQQAKEYLKCSKGFDQMIEACRCGLPIDVATIPTPPQLESDFEVVEYMDCVENSELSAEDSFGIIVTDLTHQIEVCTRNKEHFMRLGDVSTASKFEKLGIESKKDLAVVLNLKKQNLPAPKFHYETRSFSIVQCNAELSDNEIEVTVTRGINLPGKPNDLDSYVKVEFPLPTEAPQRAKTHVKKDTNCPAYEELFKFEFNRKSRATQRHFKRQALKFEIWSKGGFMRSDVLIGTVLVKLVDLESKCIIHESFDLLDGRKKSVGGSLEVKIRIRDPLLVKQVEEVKEKWLVIDN